MKYELIYIILVGSSEKAVTNSIFNVLKKNKELITKGWKLVFAKSKTTSIEGEQILQRLKQYKENYETASFLIEPEIDEFEIDEIDLEKIVEKIVIYVQNMQKDATTRIIVDVTPGRKIMSVAAAIAATKLSNLINVKDVQIAYYLLKKLDEHKDKDAPAIFPDEYDVRVWSAKKISKLMEE